MVPRFALLVLFLLFLSGCARPILTPPAPPQTPAPGENLLAGSEWRLVSLQGQPVPEQYPIYLMFDTSTFRGAMGCNNYGAHYMLDGADQIRVELLEVTVELCLDADLMRLESRYTGTWSENTIGRALRFEIREEGELLEFFDAAGNTIFLFENALSQK